MTNTRCLRMCTKSKMPVPLKEIRIREYTEAGNWNDITVTHYALKEPTCPNKRHSHPNN